MKYYSQAKQDEWVCTILGMKQGGYFVDLGAYDGIGVSNTFALETELGWSGVCVEANESFYRSLVNNRKCPCIHAAVSNRNGVCKFGYDKIDAVGGTSVPCFTLNTILEQVSAPKEIDYLSIDIEGHEVEVLQAFDFTRWNIKLITAEHNLYLGNQKMKADLYTILTSNGYVRVVEDAVCLEKHPSVYGKPFEDWYISSEYLGAYKSAINEWNVNNGKESIQ